MASPPEQLRLRRKENANTRKRSLPARQLLACTACRQRKVKVGTRVCDRTKPCFACCVRGSPNACQYLVKDGSNYEPIQQACVIRDLRREVEDLKRQLRDADETLHYHRNSDDPTLSDGGLDLTAVNSEYHPLTEDQPCTTECTKAFRAPFTGISSIKHGLLDLVQPTTYPFPALRTGDNTTAALSRLLPCEEEILKSLEVFHDIARTFPVPQRPAKTTKSEVQRFLSGVEQNATKSPDMLALLLAALALVTHMSVVSERERHSHNEVQTSVTRGECYISASMQALRNASFMSEPTLLGIKTLLVLGVNLSRTGRAEDASALFGTTVRLAYAIDLHRDPDLFLPRLPHLERMERRNIWRLMLYSDQHLSGMLCQPLTISNIGACVRPISLHDDAPGSIIADVIYHFTFLARQILSLEDTITSKEIHTFTAKLNSLWQAMPGPLRFDKTWFYENPSVDELTLMILSARVFADIQFLIILLNSQELIHLPTISTIRTTCTPQNYLDEMRIDKLQCHFNPTGRRFLAARACTGLLHAFLFLWSCGRRVFLVHPLESRVVTAIRVLLTNAVDTCQKVDLQLVDEVTSAFLEMQRSDVSRTAALAIRQILAARAQVS